MRSLVEFFDSAVVEAEILLAADEDDGQALAEMKDFGDPLCMIVSLMVSLSHKLWRQTFSCTLSRESGESTAKQIKMTWESGYERGRRRS